MTRFLRVKKTMIHVPSLANVSMSTDCFGVPYLRLFYHEHTTQIVSYSWTTWSECEKDLVRIKTAMNTVDSALKEVIMIDTEDKPVANELTTINLDQK